MDSYEYKTGTFIGNGSIEIFFRHWKAARQKGILVISHGIGDHSGRYNNIVNELKGKNISIYILDQRGHGKSGGKRGHINTFMDYINDLKFFINIIQKENQKLPLILLGHSLGGTIALKYALIYPVDLTGLILSSPALLLSMDIPAWKKNLGNFFSKYMPAMSMPTGLNTALLSHDEDVVDSYENDPLVHDRATTRLFTEMTETREHCMRMATELKLPLLIFHGKDDRIVDYKGSEMFFKKASSKIKELHIFEGLFHETMNETKNEKDKVLKIVGNWIKKSIKLKKTISGKKAVTKKNTVKKKAETKVTSKKKKVSGKSKKQTRKKIIKR